MVFLFENENYEYIKRYNLNTGKSDCTYFEFVDKQKIRSMFMSEAEDRLFCVFERRIDEIDLTTLTPIEVYRAESDAQIQAAYYCDQENSIKAVVSFAKHDS